jgi:hypothetical protein
LHFSVDRLTVRIVTEISEAADAAVDLVRRIETAMMRATPGRARGRYLWAIEQIQAGRQVRKVIWPPGPHVTAHPLARPGEEVVRVVGFEGTDIPDPTPVGWVFRDDPESRGDAWELHPPAPAIPTMHAPILWILYVLPGMGGPDVFMALLEAVSDPSAFADILLQLWERAGDPKAGKAIVAALATIDRPLFHKSLYGDVETSLRILSALTRAREGAALAPDPNHG